MESMLAQIEKEVSTSTTNALSTQGKSHDSVTELNPNQPMSEKPQILDEIVIEEVSIDGMCGVY
jgi:mycofactocin precursor